ncbi:MAG: DUF1993 domain-containing protein [Dyella sp.]
MLAGDSSPPPPDLPEQSPMTMSMYQASIPVFVRVLGNLAHVLRQGEALASAKSIDAGVLLNTRLIPDMLPLVKQVQIATDMATRGAARLAGNEVVATDDNETDFAQLNARIEHALDYLKTFQAAQIDGSEARKIVVPMRAGEKHFEGEAFLLHFVLPNLYFHASIAYAILRQAGANIGKNDFLGGV